MWEIRIKIEQLPEMLMNIGEGETLGPGRVLGHKEKCRQQLVEPVSDIMKLSLDIGRV